MAARETEQKTADQESPAPEAAPVVEGEANKTEFQTEGDLPAVAKTSAVAPITASDQAFGAPKTETKANHEIERGIHVRWEHYKAACEAAGKPEKWKDEYRNGHTEAKGWKQPYDKRRTLEWELKKGTSASQAIQDFIKGPTIADYRTAGVAHDLNEVRDDLGDRKFDRLFGSANSDEDANIPKDQRLKINPGMYSIPLIDQMKEIARKADAVEPPQEETPAPVQEARVEEKPKGEAEVEPVVVAQELGLEQADREMV